MLDPGRHPLLRSAQTGADAALASGSQGGCGRLRRGGQGGRDPGEQQPQGSGRRRTGSGLDGLQALQMGLAGRPYYFTFSIPLTEVGSKLPQLML